MKPPASQLPVNRMFRTLLGSTFEWIRVDPTIFCYLLTNKLIFSFHFFTRLAGAEVTPKTLLICFIHPQILYIYIVMKCLNIRYLFTRQYCVFLWYLPLLIIQTSISRSLFRNSLLYITYDFIWFTLSFLLSNLIIIILTFSKLEKLSKINNASNHFYDHM